ncbi:DUF6775 family putative metallopeptidase [Thermotoga sp. SG1]|uniref:DUF6775 family putative metallopeptidase n=1 Tax=Thermotoga sp. SG1 TaxID=126739 RepID=UPI000C757667|nr:DUF6775 family putative metallopeptidase [Thermotoga sp. SG1]PLV56286.1 hypothetical protein AS006_06930 [Thermotoga sp. SG1]
MRIYFEPPLEAPSFFEKIKKIFKFSVSVGKYQFKNPALLAKIRVRNPHERKFYDPFPIEIENEIKNRVEGVIYDGIELLKEFVKDVNPTTPNVLITNRLIATFGEDSRYHLRMIVMGPAAVISFKGIFYAPAKDVGYYLKYSLGFEEKVDMDVEKVLKMLLLQFYAFYEYGEIFCKDEFCFLHNCHTVCELERVKGLCHEHLELLRRDIEFENL